MASELSFLGLVDLTQRMHAKEISPVEITKRQLARIEALDGSLRSFALVLPELALDQAQQAEAEIQKGEIRGPLHGAPIGIKDLCWMKGVPTTAGMTIHSSYRPDRDATIVRKLRDAGAITLGMLRMTEGAFASHHPSLTPPVNPWNADYWTGVSSSGSGVATAAGLCYGAIGSDTGGSIRFPCAANGLTGLKPTWGRVSRYGVFELAATLDHLGPIARSAVDVAAMLGAIAGRDERDPTASLAEVPDYLATIDDSIRGIRVGVDETWNRHGSDESTARTVDQAIELVSRLGGDIRPVRFPDPAGVIDDWLPLCGVEAALAHQATYPARNEEYGPTLAGLLDIGRKLSGMDYQRIVLNRIDFRGRLQALFEQIDLLLIPAQAMAAPTNSDMARLGSDAEITAGMLRFTAPFDMSGSPTITLPGGVTAKGMPIGFQFVANHHAEALLVRAAHAYQQNSDWHRRHPDLGRP
jgi:amidase